MLAIKNLLYAEYGPSIFSDPLIEQAIGKAQEEISDKVRSKIAEANRVLESRRLRWEMKKTSEKLLPNERVSTCSKFLISIPGPLGFNRTSVDVILDHESGTCHYSGLEHCSSVWNCPICASKISEKRRKELLNIEQTWNQLGGKLYMMTLTFPHHAHQQLKDLLDKFLDARQKFVTRSTWRNYKKLIGLQYIIYSFETTHSVENGWHLHLHILFLTFDGKIAPESSHLLAAWQSACVSAGLDKPNEHGLQIQDAQAASRYISKWGVDCELAKSHVKHGHDGHNTPWDLLRNCTIDQDDRAGELFAEFAHCFKGKRQLMFTKNMRKELNLSTEEELAEEQIKEKSTKILSIHQDDWQLVIRYDHRFEVLRAAEVSGLTGVNEILIFLRMLNRLRKSQLAQ